MLIYGCQFIPGCFEASKRKNLLDAYYIGCDGGNPSLYRKRAIPTHTAQTFHHGNNTPLGDAVDDPLLRKYHVGVLFKTKKEKYSSSSFHRMSRLATKRKQTTNISKYF